MKIKRCSWFLIGISVLLSNMAFSEELNIVGTWEDTRADNHWQMDVTWNQSLNQYEGKLVKNGVASESVGFIIGELVWIATPTSNPEQLKEKQKFRNENSTDFEWREGIVNLNQSTNSSLITSQTIFSSVIPPNSDQVCVGQTEVSPSLNIHIPCANYENLGETMNIWADLKPVSSPDGRLLWELSNYGQHQ